ncbi:MAG TPA: hypothetical protein VM050_08325, partial [Patescibacteria group bacterium]|nr:hypothetical protein [Patescibacteria group bacterium]
MKNMKRAISVFIMASMLLGLLPALMPLVPVQAAISSPEVWEDETETTNITDDTTINYVFVGDTLFIKGDGVTAGSTINVYWNSVTASGLLNTTTGKSAGGYECTIDVPEAVNWNDAVHYIWVKDTVSLGTARCGGFISVNASVEFDPKSGLLNEVIDLIGHGFSSGEEILAVWDPTGTNDDIIEPDDNVEADSTGMFTTTFKVPVPDDGAYDINVTDGIVYVIEPFTVGPMVVLDLKEGTCGDVVKVTGKGFASSKIVEMGLGNITMTKGAVTKEVYTKDGKSFSTDSSGKFTAYIVIPSVPEDEDYVITFKIDLKQGTATFDIVEDGITSLKLNPGYGTPGAAITVTGYNYSKVSGVKVTITLGAQTWTTTTNSDGEFTKGISISLLDVGK